MSSTENQIIEIIQSVFPKAQGPISGDTTAAEVVGWDSLGHINLVLALEKQFAIKLRPAKLARLKNISELTSHIEEKI